MNRVDGIVETISDFFEEKGTSVGFVISDEELKQLAEDIDHGIQMHNEVSYGHIPNPMIAEVDRVKKLRKDDDMEHGREVERLRGIIEEWKRECRRLEWKVQELRAQGARD